jgi:Family of unknown function (DUF5681)
MSEEGEDLPTNKAAEGDEPVGYRRPPIGTRFRPGQSGNPRGRPKGARNLSTVVAAALGERVAVTENQARGRGQAIGQSGRRRRTACNAAAACAR